MHVGETCRREVETPEWGLHVLRDLRSLAGCTRACPCAAVFPHSQTHEPLGHQFDGGVGPVVVRAVKSVKNVTSGRRGYEWPRVGSGCVALQVDVRPGNVHPL